jgi:hypothetical protein
VLGCLLVQPLPLHSAALTVAQRLARDAPLLPTLVRRLTEVPATATHLPRAGAFLIWAPSYMGAFLIWASPLRQVINDGEAAAVYQAKTAVSAATALLAAVLEEEDAPLAPHRAELLACLLMRLGSARDADAQAHALAMQSVRSLLWTLPSDSSAPEGSAPEGAAAPRQLPRDGCAPAAPPTGAAAAETTGTGNDAAEGEKDSPPQRAAARRGSGGDAERAAVAEPEKRAGAAAAAEAASAVAAVADGPLSAAGEPPWGEGAAEVPRGRDALLAALRGDRPPGPMLVVRSLASLLGGGPRSACPVTPVFERLYPYVGAKSAAQREAITAAIAECVPSIA